ncbi:MAG: Re/Si-specific NAD(P)(+) transhydrogenase subunit alpha [Cyclobacteriaceae bacterium]
MLIGVLKEDDPRVALVPEVIQKLEDEKNEVCVEEGAGDSVFYHDIHYKQAKARIDKRSNVLKDSDIIIALRPLKEEDLKQLKKNSILVSQFEPFSSNGMVKDVLGKYDITTFSLDMIPRITLAQSMDVLSSMASIAGYKAVIEAAKYLPRYFPMLTTAAGTIPPAKVLVLGAGVAGLQAVATAKRLGAIVEVFDTRAAVKEEVQSLGAKFVEVEGAADDKGAGGYAVEQTEEYKKKQADKIKERAVQSDVVITTAQLRGKKAPILITKEAVNEMREGSVIVDIASSTGGNCELTQDSKVVQEYGVTIIGNSDLHSTAPIHASQLYSKNIYNFLKLLIKDGELTLDMEHEILKSSCLTHNGQVIYQSN